MVAPSSLRHAAEEIARIQIAYAEKGVTLSQAALLGAESFTEWRHYPSNDQRDTDTGYEFYYHAHAREETPKGEHGHFHLFRRKSSTPDRFFHLIGISLDVKGLPVRLFTTNQWVTGEVFADEEYVIDALRNFEMRANGRIAPITRWLCAFTKLFYFDITVLIRERDKKLFELVAKDPSQSDVLENRSYTVLSECSIDLMDRLSQHLQATN